MKHFDYGLVVHLMAAMLSMVNPFFYCLSGKVANESYEKMEDCWFDLKRVIFSRAHSSYYGHDYGLFIAKA